MQQQTEIMKNQQDMQAKKGNIQENVNKIKDKHKAFTSEISKLIHQIRKTES